MPRYDYVVERFKRYDAWTSARRATGEHIFRPVWSTTRVTYFAGIGLMLVLLLAIAVLTVRRIEANKVEQLSMEDFGALVRQNRESGLYLSATACPTGIIGELSDGHLYWVELGYSGTRWVSPYNLPPSTWMEGCSPPIFVQYQRMAVTIVAAVLMSGLYLALNYAVMWQRWHAVGQVTVRQLPDGASIWHQNTEFIPDTYEDIDEKFDVPTDYITIRPVIIAALVILAFGIGLGVTVAYI